MQATAQSVIRYDAIERALASCLEALADLANAHGDVERMSRFLDAAEAFYGNARPNRPTPMVAVDARPLTTREHEVALLITRGLTNRQIADALIISERTVDTHVQNILGKLGLASRAQVGAWIVERRSPSRPALYSVTARYDLGTVPY
jgi:DNA-binding NarL/FixJ family response regulator